jgi:hypothetical protein
MYSIAVNMVMAHAWALDARDVRIALASSPAQILFGGNRSPIERHPGGFDGEDVRWYSYRAADGPELARVGDLGDALRATLEQDDRWEVRSGAELGADVIEVNAARGARMPVDGSDPVRALAELLETAMGLVNELGAARAEQRDEADRQVAILVRDRDQARGDARAQEVIGDGWRETCNNLSALLNRTHVRVIPELLRAGLTQRQIAEMLETPADWVGPEEYLGPIGPDDAAPDDQAGEAGEE